MKSLSRNRKPLPTVSIVGAGRMGTALALALAARGYSIEAIVGRGVRGASIASHALQQHLRKLRGQSLLKPQTALPAPVVLSSRNLRLLPSTDLIIISTPDDAIAETAARLSKSLKQIRPRRTALHTSGALSSAVLGDLRSLNFAVGSMHPLVSISDGSRAVEKLSGAYYCLEGDAEAVAVARSIVRDLGGRHFSIHARHKALYHAAAVMASGHLVALVDLASSMLSACGLKRAQAREILTPLVRSTIDNLASHEPEQALTGTFARADTGTVLRHLAALRQLNDSDALDAYILLGRRSLQLARRNGISLKVLKQISDALDAV